MNLPQAIFLLDSSREAFYGGAAGGGKSDALLAAALQYVDVPGYAALILRRSYTDLSLPGAVMDRAQGWLAGKAHWSDQKKTWTFPSGAKLTFGYMANDADMGRYQSAEFQYVAYDELTEFTEKQYEWLFSRQRAGEGVPVPLRMRAASNPGGVGHGWVKKRFVQDETRKPGVVFVPAKLDDHPDETFKAGYRESLSNLDDVKRRRLENGDWDVGEGLAFSGFDTAVHVVANANLPWTWERFECMDFGVSNPTAWLLVGVDYDGNLVVADELYGPNTGADGKPSGGLPSETAPLVLERRRNGWEPHDEDGRKRQTNRVWADPSIRNTAPVAGTMGTRTSVQQEFADLGLGGISLANPDRRAGFLRLAELIRRDFGSNTGDDEIGRASRRFPQWHHLAGQEGSPRIFFQRRCVNTIEQIQAAPLEAEGKPLYGEAVKGDWESQSGHTIAALRYGVLSRPGASGKPAALPADPRARAMALIEARLAEEQAGEPVDGPDWLEQQGWIQDI